MTLIPPNTVSPAEIAEWQLAKKELDKLKLKEMTLRKRIFGAYFPAPEEGTNTFLLAENVSLKGGYKIDRQIDPGELQARGQYMADKGVPVGKLVDWKPQLVLKEYRKLTAEEMQLFDHCLVIKPGSPSLELVIKDVE